MGQEIARFLRGHSKVRNVRIGTYLGMYRNLGCEGDEYSRRRRKMVARDYRNT